LYPSGKPDRLLRLERHHGEREQEQSAEQTNGRRTS
jgi:hypothetical protein